MSQTEPGLIPLSPLAVAKCEKQVSECHLSGLWLHLRFPGVPESVHGICIVGSMNVLCVSSLLTRVTVERVRILSALSFAYHLFDIGNTA